jgi:hypothetical protein
MTKLTPKAKLILPSSGPTKKRIVTYSMRPWLEEGETISAASASCATLNVTVSSCTINDAALTVDGITDPIGTVVSFFVSGTGLANGVDVSVLLDVTTSEGQDFEDVPIPLSVRSG